jgi:hypothetical protein
MHGTYFLADCGDTGGNATPMSKVTIYGSGASLDGQVELGQATPEGKLGDFDATVTVPANAHGSLTVKAGETSIVVTVA